MTEFLEEFKQQVSQATLDIEQARAQEQLDAVEAAERSAKLQKVLAVKDFVVATLKTQQQPFDRMLSTLNDEEQPVVQGFAWGWYAGESRTNQPVKYGEGGIVTQPARTIASGDLLGSDGSILYYTGQPQGPNDWDILIESRSSAVPVASEQYILDQFLPHLAEIVARRQIVIPDDLPLAPDPASQPLNIIC
ncbi:MAG: hypothetical protein ABIQ89_02715 [Candidatus Saccharimonadales bacterium]